MSSESQQASSNPFVVIDRLKNNLKQLQQQFPTIKSEEDPISILEKIPSKLPIINGKPVLVTAFCGPSGAGKSTIFNLLTGLNSPTSNTRRPNSFGSLVAIPKEIFDNPERNDYLPNFKIDCLKSPDELLDKNIPKDKIFIKPYEMKYGNKSNWIYIADIPDFNGIEVSNWEKTEQMIQRADSIIFVSTAEGYADRKTIEYFIKVLRLSGKVIYLLTKVDSEQNAKNILIDRIDEKQKGYFIQNIERVDKTAVADLKKCHFYYSLRSENPKIEDIKPSTLNSNFSFIDEIFSNQNKDTILNSFCYSLKEASNLGEILCNNTSDLIKEEESYKSSIEEQVRKEADYIVGNIIPFMKIISKIIRKIQIKRFDYYKNKIKNFFRKNNATEENLKNENLKNNDNKKLAEEQERLSKAVEELFDEWLKNEKANSLMNKKVRDQAIRERIKASYKVILPIKDDGYIDDIIDEELKKKIDNGNTINEVIIDVLLLGGPGLIILDYFFLGGLGELGMMAIGGAIGGLGGGIIEYLNVKGLKNFLNNTQEEWLEKRREEYFNYLMEYANNLVLEDIDFKYLKDILEKSNKDIEILNNCSPSSFDFSDAGEQHD